MALRSFQSSMGCLLSMVEVIETVRQFYLIPIKTARDIPTTNRADSNGYLDERTTNYRSIVFESVSSWHTKSQVVMPAASGCALCIDGCRTPE